MQSITRLWLRGVAAWREQADDRGDITSDTAMMVLMLTAAVGVGGIVVALVTGAAEGLNDLMPGG